MKKIIVILVLFIYPLISFSQLNSILEYQACFDMPYEPTYGNSLYYYDGDIFTSRQNSKGFKLINLSKNSHLLFELPDSLDYWDTFTFAISKDTVFNYDWNLFHAYDLNTKKHLFSTVITGCGRNIKVIGSKVMNYGVGFCGKMDHRDQTTIDLIDLEKKNQQVLKFPNPSAEGFAFFQPSNVMEVDDKYVYIADYDNYRILIYDYNANLKDSIIRKPVEWVRTDKEIPEYPLGSYQPALFINKIRPYTAITSLIQNISVVSKNRLFIAWSIPNGKEFGYIMRYDLWEKKNGKWMLLASDLKDFEAKDNDVMDKFSLTIRYYYRVVGDYLLVKNRGTTKELFEKYQGKTYGEFQEACDEYFLDHDLKSIIGVYKFK